MEVRSCLDGQEVDSVCMQRDEMRNLPDMALDVIFQRVEQALHGQPIRRLAYADEDGDLCTLTVPGLLDALDLCSGLMLLRVMLDDDASAGWGAPVPLTGADLVSELLWRVKGLDLKVVWHRVGEEGLELLSQLQSHWQEDWSKLIHPLDALASGYRFSDAQLTTWAQLALELYRAMEPALQQQVLDFTQKSLERVAREEVATLNHVQPCARCGLCVSVGQCCAFCAQEAPNGVEEKDLLLLGEAPVEAEPKPAEMEAPGPGEVHGLDNPPQASSAPPQPGVASAALVALLQHPDPVVRAAAEAAAAAAADDASSDDASSDDADSELSTWEMVRGEAEGPELMGSLVTPGRPRRFV